MRPFRDVLELALRCGTDGVVHRGGSALDALHLFHARHLDVAAEWQGRDDVLGLAALEPDHARAEPDREARYLDVRHLRGHEMAELVHEDEHAQYDNECDDRQHVLLSAASATSRARRSAASTSSRVSALWPSCSSSARSITSAIPVNGTAPARNPATATSFAALNTAGAVPPVRPAATPSWNARNLRPSTGSNVSGPALTGSNGRVPLSLRRAG